MPVALAVLDVDDHNQRYPLRAVILAAIALYASCFTRWVCLKWLKLLAYLPGFEVLAYELALVKLFLFKALSAIYIAIYLHSQYTPI